MTDLTPFEMYERYEEDHGRGPTGHECEYRERYGNQMNAAMKLIDEKIALQNRIDRALALVRTASGELATRVEIALSHPAFPVDSESDLEPVERMTIDRHALADALMQVYDHGTSPNALREADAIIAALAYLEPSDSQEER